MRNVLLAVAIVLLLSACGANSEPDLDGEKTKQEVDKGKQTEINVTEDEEPNNVNEEDELTEEPIEEIIQLSEREEMIIEILDLVDSGLAHDTGSYIKGDIPEGNYAFITLDGRAYYSEEDSSGEIIDNENFDSFGYVYVHEAGNLTTGGVLVDTGSIESLNVSGAKELYEILNEVEDYKESGYYKVGTDIEPGEYVVESYGSGYVAVMDGPIGKSDIVKNENFDGRYAVTVNEGQYLILSRAFLSE